MPRGRVEPANGPQNQPPTGEWDGDPWAEPGEAAHTTGRLEAGFGDEYVRDEVAAPTFDVTPFDDQWELADLGFDTADEAHLAPAPNPHAYLNDDSESLDPARDQFSTDKYLRTPQKATRSDTAKRRTRMKLGIVAGTVALGSVAVVTLGGGGDADSPSAGTTAAVATTTGSAPSTIASIPGPGGTTSGPGVILGFDDAYYGQRNGVAAAAFLVASQNTPATAQAIQADIDRVDPKTTHNIVITSTETENAYNVRLTLTTPEGVSHEYHQQYTVVSSGGRFYIANKLNCDSVCPTP